LTEDDFELREKRDDCYAFYRPSSPGEFEYLNTAVMASIELGRVQASLTEIVNHDIRTAIFAYDCEQEDAVARYLAILETQPGAAVVGLKRSALGVRFLLGRWQRLLRLILDEGTLFGADRDEYITYQGSKVTTPEDLFHSEGAYLTYLFCYMCWPAPKDEKFIAMGNEKWMPPGLMDRQPKEWLGDVLLCKKLLVGVAEREILSLTQREATLREHHETPARDSAEIRKQVLATPLGMQMVRLAETHQRRFDRAFQAFLKGRAQSAKSGVLPGEPDPKLHGVGVFPSGSEPTVRVAAAETRRRQRKQVADEIAPGPQNGIGPAIPRSEAQRAAVRAEGTDDECEARQAADSAFTALAWPPVTTGEACAAYLSCPRVGVKTSA
jgi:hypothetical protein